MKNLIASFNRFEIEMPEDAVRDCNHSGECDDDVKFWASRITRSACITPEKLTAELKEFGAWDETELMDDAANWQRIVWISAGDIQEEINQK